MAESIDLTRQLQHRLESLRAAGIEHLPRQAPVALSAGGSANEGATATPGIPSGELPTGELPTGEVSTGEVLTGGGGPVGASSLFGDVAVPVEPEAVRRHELLTLETQVKACKKCPELFATRTQTVFGVGPLNPAVCFVGEAPGADEDRQGEPFVGAAGQLLNRIITACGFQRDEVYICNTLKCRPPNNRTPTSDECRNCRPFFDRQIELVNPQVIVCLGGVAAKNVLNTSTGITKLRGQVYRYHGVPVVCTYHPAYILRLQGDAERKAKSECWDDLKLMLQLIGRPIPGKK